jgi:hypothetical protein
LRVVATTLCKYPLLLSLIIVNTTFVINVKRALHQHTDIYII